MVNRIQFGASSRPHCRRELTERRGVAAAWVPPRLGSIRIVVDVIALHCEIRSVSVLVRPLHATIVINPGKLVYYLFFYSTGLSCFISRLM